jgi:hypothetical protein
MALQAVIPVTWEMLENLAGAELFNGGAVAEFAVLV